MMNHAAAHVGGGDTDLGTGLMQRGFSRPDVRPLLDEPRRRANWQFLRQC